MLKPILALLLLFLLLPSLGNIESEGEDNEVQWIVRREPTREEVLIANFKEELPQAKELLRRESGLNPEAVNPTSGAAGLGQALPPSKMPCKLSQQIGDFACQSKWVAQYVKQRYGTFQIALEFHNRNGWY